MRTFRALVDALHAIAHALMGVREALDPSSSGDLARRVDELERSRAMWEGEMQGELTKVNSRFNAVRASEERTRQMQEAINSAQADSDDPLPTAYKEAVRALGSGGDQNGVPAVHGSLEDAEGAARPSIKDRKWGRI